MGKQVTREGLFSKQICVEKGTTDGEAIAFASSAPSGTTNGWMIRTEEEDDPDYKTRVQCEECEENEHIMFDC